MRCRDEVSIHSIAEDFFVVTERVSFAPPALIDFAHTRVVDDTADYAVLMSVKTEQSTLQLHCVATIAVEESQLLLPCVYLAAAEDPIEEGVLLDTKKSFTWERELSSSMPLWVCVPSSEVKSTLQKTYRMWFWTTTTG